MSKRKTIDELSAVIYTCSRKEENYLDKTIDNLYREDVWPIVSHAGKEANNITQLSTKQKCDMPIFRLPEGETVNFEHEKIIHRANRNLAQAFMLGNLENDVLILEDDVVPCKNLVKQLKAIYWLLRMVPNCDKYIIALYNTYDWGTGPQGLFHYPVDQFYGLQACIFSSSIRKICSEYHYRMCDELPADFITKVIVKENNVKLLAVRFSLFQHMGAKTTGLGNYHMTANFLDGTVSKINI